MKDAPKKKRLSLLSWSALLSILIHIAFLFTKAFSPTTNLGLAQHQNEIPIEIAELPKDLNRRLQREQERKKEELKRLQAVETEDAQNREFDPNAQFLGEHNQIAKKQTLAPRIDDFRTKQGTGSKSLPNTDTGSTPPTASTGAEDSKEVLEGDGSQDEKQASKTGVKRSWKTLSLKDLSVGGDGGAQAAADDAVKGVDKGEGTVLSTREFRYFSYYHRIKELLRQYWKPNVEHQLARIWNKGRTINSDELTTRLLVLLDQSGHLQKVSKLSSSGYIELDEAAVEAFEKAAPFPNPPKGIVDPDGFVRIHWDFILQADSGPVIQFQTNGGVPLR